MKFRVAIIFMLFLCCHPAHSQSKQTTTEVRVPTLGNASVTKATVGHWFRKAGDAVAVDEPLVELETDESTIEVPVPSAGTLVEVTAEEGEAVAVGALLGRIEGAVPVKPAAPSAKHPKH